MDNFKKAAAEASSFFNRAKQFTEEKLGGAERTLYEPELEVLIKRADSTKSFTERIISNTNAVLQPNPNERLEDFVLTKLDRKVSKPNTLESLGQCLVEAGHELGPAFQYSNTLNKVGEIERKLGGIEKDFVQKSSDCFLQPLRSFLEGQMKIIQKEKKTLENKRLDLDACKAKLKKLKDEKYKPELQMLITKAEDDLRRAQTDFDRQAELTKLLMDELAVSYNHHLQCLIDFVDAQLNHYNNCTMILQDLSRQVGGVGIQLNYNKTYSNSSNGNLNQHATSSSASASAAATANDSSSSTTTTTTATNGHHSHATGSPGASSGFGLLNSGMQSISLANSKKAKVLFDYEATDATELSVFANQLIHVQILPNDNDWVLGESGRDSGKVPKAYIQIVE